MHSATVGIPSQVRREIAIRGTDVRGRPEACAVTYQFDVLERRNSQRIDQEGKADDMVEMGMRQKNCQRLPWPCQQFAYQAEDTCPGVKHQC